MSSREPTVSSIHPGMLFCDRYRIEQHQAEGGMGTIYLATDETSGLPVAIKVLFPHYSDNTVLRARFLDEGRIQAMLNHPNIVHVYRVITEPILSFVMEFVDGDTLEEYLQRRERLSEIEIVDLILPVMSAVGFAHNKGVIHRDLKPSNVLLKDSAGYLEPKVMDFGVAKVNRERQLTAAGTTVGTLHYMSPEQIVGASNIDGRADIYSLGCTLYKLCTGEVPFNASSEFALMMAQVEAPPTPPGTIRADLSESMERIILRALAKEPDKRFQTIREMTQALMSLVGPDKNRDTDTRPIPKEVLEFAMAADEVALDQTSKYRLEYLAAGGVPQEVVDTADYESPNNFTHELSGTAVREIASDRIKAARRKSSVTNQLPADSIRGAESDRTRESRMEELTTRPRSQPEALRATREHRKRPIRQLTTSDMEEVDLEDLPTSERDTSAFNHPSKRGILAVDKPGVDSQEVTSLRVPSGPESAVIRGESQAQEVDSTEKTAVKLPSQLRGNPAADDPDATSDERPSSRFPHLNREEEIGTTEQSESSRFPLIGEDEDDQPTNQKSPAPRVVEPSPDSPDRTREEIPSRRMDPLPRDSPDRTAEERPSNRIKSTPGSLPELPPTPRRDDAGSMEPLQQRLARDPDKDTRHNSSDPSNAGVWWVMIGAAALAFASLVLIWALFFA